MIERAWPMLLIALLARLVALPVPACAQVPQGQSASPAKEFSDVIQAFDFVLSGMKQERHKLVSGVCRFEGTLRAERANHPEMHLEGPVEGRLAIDGEKIRYDLTRPGWVIDPTTVQGGDGSTTVTADTVKGIVTTKFADDKTRATFWHSDNAMVTISRSRGSVNAQVTEYVDIRGITLYDPTSAVRGDRLEEVLEKLNGYAEFDGRVTSQENPVWVLTWGHRLDKNPVMVMRTRFSIAVDVESGFVPKSYKCECAFENEMDGDDPWRLVWENKTDWKEANGVWVPVHHEFSRFASPFGQGSERKTFDYHWESVNEPVDAGLFTHETFDVPDYVAIQDSSGPEPRWIKEFPDSSEVEPEKVVATPASFRLAGFAILGLVLAILVVGCIRKLRGSTPR